jgi:hypothetical protein
MEKYPMVNVRIDVRTCCVECKMCVTVGSLVVTMYHLLCHKNSEIFHIVHMCILMVLATKTDLFSQTMSVVCTL